MEPETIWQQLTALPLDAQREVADFIAFLQQRDRPPKPSQQSPQVDLQTDPFIGMWKDREDMQDSTQWVRTIRQGEREK